MTYDSATPLPGSAALLPVVAALAVIWAGRPASDWGPMRVLHVRPVQYLGDVSYSVYLWHWPLLVLAPFALGAALDASARAAIVALTAGGGIADEGPCRRPPSARAPARGPPRRRGRSWARRQRPPWCSAHPHRARRAWRRRCARTHALADVVLRAPPRCFGAAARDPQRTCRNESAATRRGTEPDPRAPGTPGAVHLAGQPRVRLRRRAQRGARDRRARRRQPCRSLARGPRQDRSPQTLAGRQPHDDRLSLLDGVQGAAPSHGGPGAGNGRAGCWPGSASTRTSTRSSCRRSRAAPTSPPAGMTGSERPSRASSGCGARSRRRCGTSSSSATPRGSGAARRPACSGRWPAGSPPVPRARCRGAPRSRPIRRWRPRSACTPPASARSTSTGTSAALRAAGPSSAARSSSPTRVT